MMYPNKSEEMPTMCPNYAKEMTNISPTYAKNITKIGLRYAKDMPMKSHLANCTFVPSFTKFDQFWEHKKANRHST